jgi:hypothetical protein
MTLPTDRNFFGSRHGKGPCHALGGLVKNCATRYVKSCTGIIANSQDMLKYTLENLEVDKEESKRTFFLITTEEIQKRRDNKKIKLKPIPDTQDLHAVTNSVDGLIKRFLSCYCKPCRNGNFAACENDTWVEPWTAAFEKYAKTLQEEEKNQPLTRKKNVGKISRLS